MNTPFPQRKRGQKTPKEALDEVLDIMAASGWDLRSVWQEHSDAKIDAVNNYLLAGEPLLLKRASRMVEVYSISVDKKVFQPDEAAEPIQLDEQDIDALYDQVAELVRNKK